jgi:hypothetical protein
MLSTYLNDHLAGATVGLELARRAARSNRRSHYGPFLERLAIDIDDDREVLAEIMRALGIGIDRRKVLGGWGAEKLGRLKLNGRLLSYSPLSRVVELEALLLAVHGKLALWHSLERLEAERSELKSFQLETLKPAPKVRSRNSSANDYWRFQKR